VFSYFMWKRLGGEWISENDVDVDLVVKNNIFFRCRSVNADVSNDNEESDGGAVESASCNKPKATSSWEKDKRCFL